MRRAIDDGVTEEEEQGQVKSNCLTVSVVRRESVRGVTRMIGCAVRMRAEGLWTSAELLPVARCNSIMLQMWHRLFVKL